MDDRRWGQALVSGDLVSAEPEQSLPPLVRARDLRKMGLTRTDAERVMHLAGTLRIGKAVYAERKEVERVLAEARTPGFA